MAGDGSAVHSHRDGSHDFDFLLGEWRVHNRRLRTPLSGSTEWYEFDAWATIRPMWEGAVNVDEFEGEMPTGRIQGLTVRLYKPATDEWLLYWANRAAGEFSIPTVGRFTDGRGEFFDEEMLDGHSIKVRFLWCDIEEASCRWEQAFSADEGRTWETNWVMELSRVG